MTSTDTTVDPVVEEEVVAAEEPVVEAVAEEAPAEKKSTKTLLEGSEGEDGEKGLPEKYGFTPPDDLKDYVDPDGIEAALEGFQEIAKDAGLTQEQFQKLVEFDARRGRDGISKQADQYAERLTKWADAAQKDKEIGGDALPANLKLAEIGLEKLGDKDLRALLRAPDADNPEGLGLGNHPAVLRLFARAGKLFADPGLVKGNTASAEVAQLKRMYPSMFENAE